MSTDLRALFDAHHQAPGKSLLVFATQNDEFGVPTAAWLEGKASAPVLLRGAVAFLEGLRMALERSDLDDLALAGALASAVEIRERIVALEDKLGLGDYRTEHASCSPADQIGRA